MFLAHEDFGLTRFDDVALLSHSTLIDQELPCFDLDVVGEFRHSVEFGVTEPLEEGQFSKA